MHYSSPQDSRKSTVLRSSFPPTRVSFPSPARGGGQGGLSSADTGTFVGEFAISLEAAFVDAFQAFRNHCLQFPDLVLLLGVFRIHQCVAVT